MLDNVVGTAGDDKLVGSGVVTRDSVSDVIIEDKRSVVERLVICEIPVLVDKSLVVRMPVVGSKMLVVRSETSELPTVLMTDDISVSRELSTLPSLVVTRVGSAEVSSMLDIKDDNALVGTAVSWLDPLSERMLDKRLENSLSVDEVVGNEIVVGNEVIPEFGVMMPTLDSISEVRSDIILEISLLIDEIGVKRVVRSDVDSRIDVVVGIVETRSDVMLPISDVMLERMLDTSLSLDKIEDSRLVGSKLDSILKTDDSRLDSISDVAMALVVGSTLSVANVDDRRSLVFVGSKLNIVVSSIGLASDVVMETDVESSISIEKSEGSRLLISVDSPELKMEVSRLDKVSGVLMGITLVSNVVSSMVDREVLLVVDTRSELNVVKPRLEVKSKSMVDSAVDGKLVSGNIVDVNGKVVSKFSVVTEVAVRLDRILEKTLDSMLEVTLDKELSSDVVDGGRGVGSSDRSGLDVKLEMILETKPGTEVVSRVVVGEILELIDASKLEIDDSRSELMLDGPLVGGKVDDNTVVVSSIMLGSVIVLVKEVKTGTEIVGSSDIVRVSEVDEIGIVVDSDGNSDCEGMVIKVSEGVELSRKLDGN